MGMPAQGSGGGPGVALNKGSQINLPRFGTADIAKTIRAA